MKAMGIRATKNTHLLIVAVLLTLTAAVQATTGNWQRRDVNWRATGGRSITGIYVPQDEPFAITPGQSSRLQAPASNDTTALSMMRAAAASTANPVDSPPVAGFTVNIAIAVTSARAAVDSNRVAQPHSSIVGNFLTRGSQTDFAMGIFDTGASFHLMGYAAAEQTGIVAANLLTSYTIQLSGATGSTSASVSQPLAIFIDGLSAIDPNTTTVDHSHMVGQSNVAIAVAQKPQGNAADLGTAIGTPMSVNFAAAISNDHQITLTRDRATYAGPDVKFYDLNDPCAPRYPNRAALNLVPAGAVDVEYFPGLPSFIVGDATQSKFFFDSVNLYEGAYSSLAMHGFMLDTGSQITIVSSDIGARLNLNTKRPDFKLVITGITNDIATIPGFFVDALDVPAAGDPLSYTHVPVIILDIASPDGGYLDGIIGTNLFVDFNLVLRGGGLPGQDPPSLAFQRIISVPTADTSLP